METTTPIQRYTTQEVAKLLNCRRVCAVQLLRGAGLTPIRCGPAFLWDAAAVNRINEALKAARAVNA